MNSAQLAMTHLSSLTRTFTIAALILGLGVTTALAQDQEYAQMFNEARQIAQEASQLEGTDFEAAAAQYAEGYQIAAQAGDLAADEGQLEHADQIREFGARLAYRAGKLLFDNERAEASIDHFEAGIDIFSGFQANHQGLSAAERSLAQAGVVEASQALNEGDPVRAIELLEDADENSTVFFYRAEAYMQLNQDSNALQAAQAALNEGDNNAERRSRLNLIIGEVHMSNGNDDQARAALQSAASEGPPSVRDRAQALLDRL